MHTDGVWDSGQKVEFRINVISASGDVMEPTLTNNVGASKYF